MCLYDLCASTYAACALVFAVQIHDSRVSGVCKSANARSLAWPGDIHLAERVLTACVRVLRALLRVSERVAHSAYRGLCAHASYVYWDVTRGWEGGRYNEAQ